MSINKNMPSFRFSTGYHFIPDEQPAPRKPALHDPRPNRIVLPSKGVAKGLQAFEPSYIKRPALVAPTKQTSVQYQSRIPIRSASSAKTSRPTTRAPTNYSRHDLGTGLSRRRSLNTFDIHRPSPLDKGVYTVTIQENPFDDYASPYQHLVAKIQENPFSDAQEIRGLDGAPLLSAFSSASSVYSLPTDTSYQKPRPAPKPVVKRQEKTSRWSLFGLFSKDNQRLANPEQKAIKKHKTQQKRDAKEVERKKCNQEKARLATCIKAQKKEARAQGKEGKEKCVLFKRKKKSKSESETSEEEKSVREPHENRNEEVLSETDTREQIKSAHRRRDVAENQAGTFGAPQTVWWERKTTL